MRSRATTSAARAGLARTEPSSSTKNDPAGSRGSRRMVWTTPPEITDSALGLRLSDMRGRRMTSSASVKFARRRTRASCETTVWKPGSATASRPSPSTHTAWRSAPSIEKLRSMIAGMVSVARSSALKASGAVMPMRIFARLFGCTGNICTSTWSAPLVVTSSGSRRVATTRS
jgi:hypothetical protein